MSATTAQQFVSPVSKVPTSTLGSLLYSHRENLGFPIRALASATGLSEEDIRSVETGRHNLDVDSLALLIDAYTPPTAVGFGRFANLVVDIGSVSVALVHSEVLVTESQAADRILGHYLDFLYADRDLPMGTRLSIREVDLSVVRDSLALRRDAVSGHIERLEVGELDSTDRNNLLLLAGLLCATAALVVGGSPTSNTPTTPTNAVPDAIAAVNVVEEITPALPGDVIVEIGEAASITREPAAGMVVSVEIGTAVVEER